MSPGSSCTAVGVLQFLLQEILQEYAVLLRGLSSLESSFKGEKQSKAHDALD